MPRAAACHGPAMPSRLAVSFLLIGALLAAAATGTAVRGERQPEPRPQAKHYDPLP